MHVRGAKLGIVLENKGKRLAHVECAVRDRVVDLEASEVVICDMDAHGQCTCFQRCPIMCRGALSVCKAFAEQHEQSGQG